MVTTAAQPGLIPPGLPPQPGPHQGLLELALSGGPAGGDEQTRGHFRTAHRPDRPDCPPVAEIPVTRYAKCDDLDIAYQVLGNGPLDLLLFTGSMIPIECMDEEPSMVRFLRRLSSFSRLVRFDRRGVGLSDRGSPKNPPTIEDWMEDAVAVLDAVGSERAAVIGPFISSPEALLLAARHPHRVESLIIINGHARVPWGPDYPEGIALDVLEIMRACSETDAREQGVDLLAGFAPSVSDDPAFRAWWSRAGNLGSTPAMALAAHQTRLAADVRNVLGDIQARTLIIERKDTLQGVERARYLADHISGARYVELDGRDVLYWVGETGVLLDEIEEFLTGVRGGSDTESVLATILFTDIVGSTDQAAKLGDKRWRDLLERHDRAVRQQLERFGGHEVDTAGDGFLATFNRPRRAIECALAIRDTLKSLGIEVRSGLHTGEIELRGDDVAGMAVHIGARVAALANAGEVLVSGAVPPLVVGSGIDFEDRGNHDLKGVPGSRKLFVVTS